MRKNEVNSWGEEILRANGGRKFSYNGRKFEVIDLPKQDKKDGYRYCLMEKDSDDIYHLMYNNIGWDTPKFRTIRDARMYVRDYHWMLERFI